MRRAEAVSLRPPWGSWRYGLWALVMLWVVPASGAAEPALRLTLPPEIAAVVGVEMNVYFANVILSENPEAWSFHVTCPLGNTDARRWHVTATDGQAGSYPFALTVKNSAGEVVVQGSTQLRVVPASAGQGRAVRLLIVGDSLTAASQYPASLARLLARPGNPSWEMLGTQRRPGPPPGVAHEGYGGWTWRAFNTYVATTPPGPGRPARSPFVFAGAPSESPQLDVSRYVAETLGGQPPDYVTFLLGINDCFGLKASDSRALDAGIDAVFREADRLLAEFRRVAPQARLGVCLTPPPNDRESAFQANYQDKYRRWNWRQVQHRLVERQLQHFQGRGSENIQLVATELNLDTLHGYPDNNAVHPNAAGYEQIGATIYSWLKADLARD
ncbi:MAG: SGNH/GDSL hydrolase family protein [Pirellulales bacterium]